MRLPNVRRPPPPGRPTVFISYRRDDSSGYAGRLHDALRERWGEGNVRMDVDDIPPGADYTQAAREMVASSDIVLVLIGKRWLEGSNAERLADPADLLRQEVETALKKNVRVIPVLLNGASMPAPEALPASLAPLLTRNAFELSERRWTYDVQDLVTTVERLPVHAALTDAPEPAVRPPAPDPPLPSRRPATAKRFPLRSWERAVLALLAVAAVVGAVRILADAWVSPENMSTPPLTDTAVALDLPYDTPAVLDRPLPPVPVAEEDCRRFNPRALKVERSSSEKAWVLTDGVATMAYLDDEADAQRALAVARRHTEHCFIGRYIDELDMGGLGYPDRDRYITDYWIGDSGIATTVSDEDCVAYAPAALRVVERSRSWPHMILQDGTRALASFETLEGANRAREVARGAAQLCYIGRDNSRPNAEAFIMEYWR